MNYQPPEASGGDVDAQLLAGGGEEQEAVYIMRRALNSLKADEAVEQILNMFSRTRNNAEFVQMAKKQKFL